MDTKSVNPHLGSYHVYLVYTLTHVDTGRATYRRSEEYIFWASENFVLVPSPLFWIILKLS